MSAAGKEELLPGTSSSGQSSSGWFLSFITLSKTIIGAGVLALPYTLAQTGIVVGLVLLGLAALVQVRSGCLDEFMAVIICGDETGWWWFARRC